MLGDCPDIRMLRRLFCAAAIAGVVLASCSTLNEGSTDYRRAAWDRDQPDTGHLTLVAKYDADRPNDNDAVKRLTACEPAVKAAVAKCALKDARVIEKDNLFYISLSQGFIQGISESFDTQTLRYGERVGEIAIIVRAEEITSKTDFGFGARLSDTKGRVVFYSNDVRQGQFLNLSFMPIMGPIAYKGGPLLLDIYVVEVDSASNEKFSAILSSLAELGKGMFAPTSLALNLLESIGSKLLSGRETDDVEMHYSAVFMPGNVGAALENYPQLRAGDYVFARLHDRTEDLAWRELRLDRNTGRVVRPNCAPLDAVKREPPPSRSDYNVVDEASTYLYDDAPVRADDCIFRGATYLTLQINKGDFPQTLEYEGIALNELNKRLSAGENDADSVAAALKAAAETVKAAGDKKKAADAAKDGADGKSE